MPRSDNPNYFAKLQKCHVCTEPCPQAEMAREIGEDRLYKTQELIRLIKQIDSGELVPVVHGCKFCRASNNDFQMLNTETWEYSGIEIAINRQGMLRVRHYDYDPNVYHAQEIITIKHCPMCGAKMDGGEDNDIAESD